MYHSKYCLSARHGMHDCLDVHGKKVSEYVASNWEVIRGTTRADISDDTPAILHPRSLVILHLRSPTSEAVSSFCQYQGGAGTSVPSVSKQTAACPQQNPCRRILLAMTSSMTLVASKQPEMLQENERPVQDAQMRATTAPKVEMKSYHEPNE